MIDSNNFHSEISVWIRIAVWIRLVYLQSVHVSQWPSLEAKYFVQIWKIKQDNDSPWHRTMLARTMTYFAGGKAFTRLSHTLALSSWWVSWPRIFYGTSSKRDHSLASLSFFFFLNKFYPWKEIFMLLWFVYFLNVRFFFFVSITK